eukprot:TRINITY_DN21356_c0_g1_i6.p1 TRINITY_DN21356_c0_g1~~TRINITY_DN21356_c0_g1_i6.p1  ORF type:complete len:123 (+),score=18.52 TRINITY_DN21356_c0_g1_i6:451-819(+)
MLKHWPEVSHSEEAVVQLTVAPAGACLVNALVNTLAAFALDARALQQLLLQLLGLRRLPLCLAGSTAATTTTTTWITTTTTMPCWKHCSNYYYNYLDYDDYHYALLEGEAGRRRLRGSRKKG